MIAGMLAAAAVATSAGTACSTAPAQARANVDINWDTRGVYVSPRCDWRLTVKGVRPGDDEDGVVYLSRNRPGAKARRLYRVERNSRIHWSSREAFLLVDDMAYSNHWTVLAFDLKAPRADSRRVQRALSADVKRRIGPGYDLVFDMPRLSALTDDHVSVAYGLTVGPHGTTRIEERCYLYDAIPLRRPEQMKGRQVAVPDEGARPCTVHP